MELARPARPFLLAVATALALVPACGDDGGTATSGGPGGTGGGAPLDPGPGTPIDAPPETWTWVDFEDAVCGDGSPTGLGVNPSATGKDVFLFLQGGGACWNEETCFTIGLATHVKDGYDAGKFASDRALDGLPFERMPENPFADANFVYVPYCTGDVHAGDATATYGDRTVEHRGARNLAAFLVRLRATFVGAPRVYLVGSSAGAFGAELNFEQVRAAFPGSEVHGLADSGQMIQPSGTLLEDWNASWGIPAVDACPECLDDFARWPDLLATKYPDSRFALLGYTRDGVLRTFFGLEADAYETANAALLARSYDPHANARYFVLDGAKHTMLGTLATEEAPSGETLRDFLEAFRTGDPAWASVAP